METLRDNKFNTAGKVRVVKASIAQTNTSSLALVLVALAENGQPNSKVYDILNKKWSKIKPEAKGWWQGQFDFKKGNIHQTATSSDTWITHMLCFDKEGKLDETALTSCMKKVASEAASNKASVHVSSLLIETIPQLEAHLQNLVNAGTNVFFYTGDEPVETPQ